MFILEVTPGSTNENSSLLWASEVTQIQKKNPCCLYLYHQNPNTAPALCHRCLAASESLLRFKASGWSPRDRAWEHANKFLIIHRKGDKRVQPGPLWEGNKQKSSFNTTPRITCHSIYHRSGLATKGFGKKKKSNLGNAAVFKAVYSQGWKGRTGRCRQVLLKGAWSPIICFWVGPLETLHHGRLYVNQVKRAENSPLTLLITSLPLAKATPALPAGEVMGTVWSLVGSDTDELLCSSGKLGEEFLSPFNFAFTSEKANPKPVLPLCIFFISLQVSPNEALQDSSYFPKVSKSPYLKLSLLRKLQPTSASAMFGIILGNTKQEHFSLENIPQKRRVFGTERSVLFHSCREPSVERRCSWEVARVSAASPLRRADLN